MSAAGAAPRPIHTLLIANRGEIARRIARAARRAGMRVAAVFSDADADAPFVREADVAVRIGGTTPATSYNAIDKLLEAARRAGADAVHPGYGFLSEDPAFAAAVVGAGLRWVGPPADAIAAMGSKAAARQAVAARGVPVLPGYDGDAQDDATLLAEGARVGVPLLVKAAAGGGGRGMRQVADLPHLPDAIATARREAESAFGDGRLILERLVLRPRHVEVQVVADAFGAVVALGERECSVQRRHQKVLEEAPSPAVSPELRARMAAFAVEVARAVDYVGVGTVEMLLDPSGEVWFLEMNTRLQVEHPVTELVTGIDLVALQLGVAEGRALESLLPPAWSGAAPGEGPLRGWAIEARVVAEDPARDLAPSTGTLHRVHLPVPAAGAGGSRVDDGVVAGSEVGVYYDGLLAKVIAWGPDRGAATRALACALQAAWLPGVATNLPLLRDVLATDAWHEGRLHTGFLAEHGLPVAPPSNLARGAVAVAAWSAWRARAAGGGPAVGWRLWGRAAVRDRYAAGPEEVAVQWTDRGGATCALTVGIDADEHAVTVHAVRDEGGAGHVMDLEVDGLRGPVRIAASHLGVPDDNDVIYVHLGDAEAMVRVVPRFPAPAAAEAPAGSAVAPSPAVVRAVHVAVGDVVAAGDPLVTVEAMKLETTLRAAEAGAVVSVRAAVGASVAAGDLLVVVAPAEG